MSEQPTFELNETEPVTTLVLEAAPFKGLEFVARVGLSPATYFGVRQWVKRASDAGTAVQAAVQADDGSAFGASYAEFVTAVQGAGKLFAELGLRSWGVQRDGQPVPPTVEGMATLDVGLQVQIVTVWADAIGTVSVPLSAASTTGKASRTRTKRTPSTSGPSSTGTSPTQSTNPGTQDA